MSCLIVGQRAPVWELLCNHNFNGLSGRCTPIRSVKDDTSCGFPTFRRTARKCPDQSIQARLSVLIRRTHESLSGYSSSVQSPSPVRGSVSHVRGPDSREGRLTLVDLGLGASTRNQWTG